MAKQIYLSDEDIEAIIEETRNELMNTKSFGKIEIKKDFTKDKRRATIYFTPIAWIKYTSLVKSFDTEIEWHGCVERLSENEFEIYDILVPPHVVTGTTVTADYEKYGQWINDLDDDTFKALRFHGHSHVNMGCSPSSTDMQYRKDIVTQLPRPKTEDEDEYYIFMIFNKRGEWTGEIYDITNNALYDKNEIDIDIYSEENNCVISEFIEEAKKLAVKEEPEVKEKTKKEKEDYKFDKFDKYQSFWDRYQNGYYGEN